MRGAVAPRVFKLELLVDQRKVLIQSDLTYSHTSVSGGFANKVRELDK